MKNQTTVELSLRVLGFLEDGKCCALALEMDLRGYGDTFEEAKEDLRVAVERQLAFAIQMKNPEMALFPAEQKYFDLYNDTFAKAFAGNANPDTFDDGREYGLSFMPIQGVAKGIAAGVYA